MDIGESVLSVLEDLINLVLSGSLGDSDSILNVSIQGFHVYFGPVFIILWLNSIVSDKVVMGIWGRPLVTDIGSHISWAIGSISSLMLHLVSVLVSVVVTITNVVIVSTSSTS